MASKWIFLQGKAKWCRPHMVNQWGDYTMQLYLTPESLDTVRELQGKGLKNLIKKDEDGWNIRLKRPSQRTFGTQVRGFAPPDVFEGDGKTPLRGINIGNGSDVTCKVEVYQYTVPGSTPPQKAAAMRWAAIAVNNLVPFDAKHDMTDAEATSAEGLAEQKEWF